MLEKPLPIIGVELGRRQENTALSVTEKTLVPTGEYTSEIVYSYGDSGADEVAYEKVATEYHVRHLQRLKPPVNYEKVAQRVANLTQSVGGGLIVVDITRTGRPVYDVIRRAVAEMVEDEDTYVTFGPVSVSGIAGGVSKSPDAGHLVPRRDLVSSALLAFEANQLKIAGKLGLARTLTKEFVDFKPQPDPKDDLEGWRLASNDDLVLAVSMSVWASERFLRRVESVTA